MRAGMGVNLSMWIMDRASGRWPSREPTKNNLNRTVRGWFCSMRLNQKFAWFLPGRCDDGGVEASVAGQSHGDGDNPAHETQSVVCKSLNGEDVLSSSESAVRRLRNRRVCSPLRQRHWPGSLQHPEQHSRRRSWGCRWWWRLAWRWRWPEGGSWRKEKEKKI